MTKFTSFVDIQITVYRGSWAVEIVPGTKTVRYGPLKWQEMTKFTSFVDFQITVYRASRAVKIVPGAKKTVCYSPRNGENEKIHEFNQLSNYHIPGVTGR